VRQFAVLLPLALLTAHAAPKTGETSCDRCTPLRRPVVSQHHLRADDHLPRPPRRDLVRGGHHPGKLRIDVAPADSMTAFMFVGDSTVVFRGGKRVARARSATCS